MSFRLLAQRRGGKFGDDDQLGIAERRLDALALVLGLGHRPLARP